MGEAPATRTTLYPAALECLPAGWHLFPIGKVLERSQYGLNVAADPDGDVQIVGMKDIVDGRVSVTDLGVTRVNGNEKIRYTLRRGDILINRTNSYDLVGKVAIFDADIEAVFASYLVRLEVKKNLVDPWFLNYWLNHSVAQHTIKRIATRAVSQANINPTEFKKYCVVPLPPLAEQRRIVEILRPWDDAIKNLEALQKAKTVRLQWFRTEFLAGKRRLHGFSSEWPKVPLSHVLTEHGLTSKGTEEVYSVSVRLGLVHQIEHLGRSFAAKETAHYNRVLHGDIVYTKSPTGDFPFGIIKQSNLGKEVIVSPLYGVFSPMTRHLGIILDAYFESPVAARNYLYPLVQKGAKNTIAITNKRFLEGKLLLALDPAEQEALAELLETVKAEIALIKAECNALNRQKRGLMQKLLIGEWRVPTEDGDVEWAAEAGAKVGP